MEVLSIVFVGLVALEHLYIVALEMFLWTQTRTRKIFGTTAEFAESTKTLAANQGLYNGFLAVGLLYGIVANIPDVAFQFKVFFLVCVIVAGIYGGVTVKPRIAMVQALPAFIALVFTLINGVSV